MGGRRIIWLEAVGTTATLELLLCRCWLLVVGGVKRLVVDERLEVENDKLEKEAFSDERAFEVKAETAVFLLLRLTAKTPTDMAVDEAAIIWFGVMKRSLIFPQFTMREERVRVGSHW